VAAELADSIGVDIISSSLGYTTFDDASLNHQYSDLNGHTTLVAKAATMAASKGIIVVVSAGNEGNKPWKYISTPADADSILTVGAIDTSSLVAPFSSIGPTFDGRVKPDLVAVGSGTVVQQSNNDIVYGSGTSFSAPIIAGLTACLWQACPGKSNMEIIRAIQQSSSQYNSPDNTLGYGIPNYITALENLLSLPKAEAGKIRIYPNPAVSEVTFLFEPIPEGTAQLMIFNLTGRQLFNRQLVVSTVIVNSILITEIASFPRGIYIAKVFSRSKTLVSRFLKL
jgi:subtilisin family serine protease